MSFAMVFPGQGSQSVGMFDAYGASNEVLETVRSASEILHQDVARLVRDGPAEELSRTTNTQPLMVIAGMVAFRCWQAQGGPLPTFVAGHSLGEYTALVVSGALTFEACLPLVRLRAQAMQDAVPQGVGAMAAILGLDLATVLAAASEASKGQVCGVANDNAPGQVVISGDLDAVNRAIELCKAAGAKRALTLPVSAPFHCALMQPAAEAMQDALGKVAMSVPVVPLVANVLARPISDPAEIRKRLVEQVTGVVRWTETIQLLRAEGVTQAYEIGPGNVLAGLTKQIAPEIEMVKPDWLAAG